MKLSSLPEIPFSNFFVLYSIVQVLYRDKGSNSNVLFYDFILSLREICPNSLEAKFEHRNQKEPKFGHQIILSYIRYFFLLTDLIHWHFQILFSACSVHMRVVQNSAFWLRYILFIGLFIGFIHLGSLTLGVYCNMQMWLISATWGQVLNPALDCLHFSIDLCYFVKI
jgi:hypothetical protein